jgi:hypothetical protein
MSIWFDLKTGCDNFVLVCMCVISSVPMWRVCGASQLTTWGGVAASHALLVLFRWGGQSMVLEGNFVERVKGSGSFAKNKLK